MSKEDIRIAYFIDRLIQGGTELQLVEQINQLHLRGIYQELFCLYKSRDHDKIYVRCKVNILDIKKLISLRCMRRVYWLVKYLRHGQFKIVQTYFFDSTVVGVTAARLSARMKILSCRRDLGFWYTPKLLSCLRIINKMTDRILVNSNAVKQSVMENEKAPSKQIDIIPNGIDISKFIYSPEQRENNRSKLSLKTTEFCVGIVANMDRKVKRLDLFIRAAGYVLGVRTDVKFIILGDGNLKGELINMTRQLGIEDHMVFLGSEVSKHEVLSALDIGVLTSDSEGFSNAIMEYMAAGLPVVATDVGGNKELVNHNETGFLIRPDDYKELGNKIVLLANDQQKCLELGLNGRNAITNHNWGRIIDNMLNYYKQQVKL